MRQRSIGLAAITFLGMILIGCPPEQPNGTLTVKIEPAEVNDYGAHWAYVDDELEEVWQDDEVAEEVAAGVHTITFAEVPGWVKPPDKEVVVPAGKALEKAAVTITGTYLATTAVGSLKVTITPSSAVSAGAQWALDAGVWQSSGTTLTQVGSGTHRVSFKPVAGWIKPVTKKVTVTVGTLTTTSGAYTQQLASTAYVVLGYNDLGMHCMNNDFSELMVLPPYNNLHATVIKRGEDPDIVTSGVTIRYAIQGNTYSVGKTNFWTYVNALFHISLASNMGLTGKGLNGTMTSLSASGRTDWSAEGIPVTPIEDSGVENPYPLATITVSRNGQNVVQTQAVTPVSWEMNCNLCHAASTGVSVAQNILLAHDRLHKTALAKGAKPVACGSCHAQPALGWTGDAKRHNLSRAMHGAHANRMSAANLKVACYACHPGIRTQCQRDIHFMKGLNCVNCHGSMSAVAAANRVPWSSEPRCDGCHSRSGFAFEQANTLYRNSKGHHGVHCEACHGSPHAITPTVKAEDNIQAIALQGHAGVINTCIVCHTETPEDSFDHRLDDDKAAL